MSLGLLREQISKSFTQDEIKTICFDLDIDYESLPGEGKVAKVREMLSLMDRTGRMDILFEHLKHRRPHLAWAYAPSFDKDSEQMTTAPRQPKAKRNNRQLLSYGIIILIVAIIGLLLVANFEKGLQIFSSRSHRIQTSPDFLVGQWQTFWDVNGEPELIVIAIPEVPKIGETAGTIGYLYGTSTQFHCGIDIWYGGFDGETHRFNAWKDSGDFVEISGRGLPACVELGIIPFDYYKFGWQEQSLTFKQVFEGQESSSTILRLVENNGE